MAALFLRECSLVVANDDGSGFQVDGLRVVFRVTKTLKKEPNTADIKVYNLSRETRGGIQARAAKILLKAGYRGSSAIIFSGDARTVDSFREGPEGITHIQCGDGERAYQFGRINQSFSPGVLLKDVARAAVAKLRANPGNLEAAFDAARNAAGSSISQFSHGYTANGKASAVLDKMARSAGLTWSVQDGVVQFLRAEEPAQNTAVLLTPETGLEGSPQQGSPEKKGGPSVLKVKSRLQAGIVCGGKIDVRAENVRGIFKVEKLEHSGDNHGAEWNTNIEARPV